MDHNDLKRVIEALIFAADAPLQPERIRETLEACSDEEIAQVVEGLNGEYAAAGHAFMIRAVAGGYQVTTRPQFSNWIKRLYLGRQKGRLSQAALESLAIIAFKQPISRVDIAQIRGVNSDGVIGTLLERKLITISGRSEGVGRPLLYSTTPDFLEFFGINDLAELPKPREIEELIGKEGMSEEVLQALSSDKQLKLPISFEPEAETSDASQSESAVAALSSEQIVEAISLKGHDFGTRESTADSASPLGEASLTRAASEERIPESDLGQDVESELDDIDAMPVEDEHGDVVENSESGPVATVIHDDSQHPAAAEPSAASAEAATREDDSATPQQTAALPQEELQPAMLPLPEKSEELKRTTQDEGPRDGDAGEAMPTAEKETPQTSETARPEDDRAEGSASDATSQAAHEAGLLEEKPAHAEDSEKMELDSWPEVTEVRVEEPASLAEEFAPLALSEIGEQRDAVGFQTSLDNEPESEVHAREEDFIAETDTLTVERYAAPATVASDQSFANTRAEVTNEEQVRRLQVREELPVRAEEWPEAAASDDEGNGFFV